MVLRSRLFGRVLLNQVATRDAYFNPDSISGLIGWWSADFGVTTAGSGVSLWNNRSTMGGTGYDLTQGTDANRPLLVADSLNGRPVIQMDGVNDFLSFTGTGLDIFRNLGDATIFIIAAPPDSYTDSFVNLGISTGDSGTNSRFQLSNLAVFKTQSISRRLDAVAGTADPSADWSYETPSAYKVWTIQPSWTNATIKQWFNSTLIVNDSSFTTAGTTSDTRSQVGRLGQSQSGTFSSPLKVAEILVYQAALTPQEILDVETYLAKKWKVARTHLITDGDSGTDGGMSVILIDKHQRWPSQMVSQLAPNIALTNYAASGNTIVQRDAAAPTGLDIHTFAGYTTKRVLWLWAGSNDMTLGATPAQTYNNLKTYLTNRLAAGNFDEIGYATPMTRYNTSTMEDMTPKIQEYSDLVRAGWDNGNGELYHTYGVRHFKDIAADPRFDDANDTLDTDIYQTDRTHLTVLGYSQDNIAGLMYEGLQTALS